MSIGAINEVHEWHAAIISDCKVWRDMSAMCVTFEFFLDMGEGAEIIEWTRTMTAMNLMSRPGYDIIRNSSQNHGRSLLRLCEIIEISYEELKQAGTQLFEGDGRAIHLPEIAGKEVAIVAGPLESVPCASMWTEAVEYLGMRFIHDFRPVSELATMAVVD